MFISKDNHEPTKWREVIETHLLELNIHDSCPILCKRFPLIFVNIEYPNITNW